MTRSIKLWAVEYETEEECECGCIHSQNNILVGLATKAEAIKRAKELNGTTTREWFTPKLTDKEIKLLNREGIPIGRNCYGLYFEGIRAVFGDYFSDLEEVRKLWADYSKIFNCG